MTSTYIPNENDTCDTLPLHPIVPPESIRFYLYRYVYPVNFSFGFCGNLLTFFVLVTPGMWGKSTGLLACMTFSDLLFILTRFPLSLATFDSLAHSEGFRKFYFLTNIPLVAASNWFSLTSIWFAVAVTIERTLAIWRPFQPCRAYLRPCHIMIMGGLVFVCGFFLTFFTNLLWEYHPSSCKLVYSANGVSSFVRTRPLLTKTKDEEILLFEKTFTIISILIIVAVPMTLLLIFNSILLWALAQSRRELQVLGRTTSSQHAKRQERKVAALVVVITGSFIVFNLLSVFVTFVRAFHVKIRLRGLVDISNYLVLFGKTLNFLLYCIASERFRQYISTAISERYKRLRGWWGERVEPWSVPLVRRTFEMRGEALGTEEEEVSFIPNTPNPPSPRTPRSVHTPLSVSSSSPFSPRFFPAPMTRTRLATSPAPSPPLPPPLPKRPETP